MSNLLCDLNLVDVGASGGLFKPFSIITEKCTKILIEPSTHHFDKLTSEYHSDDYILVNQAAGSKTETKILYDSTVGGASLYRRNDDIVLDYVDPALFENATTQQISLKSIGEMLSECGVERVDGIKIDTQGSEFEILLGLKKSGYLDEILLLQVEIPSIPTSYLDQPRMSDVIKFAEESGFHLLSLKANNAFKLVNHKTFARRGTLSIGAKVMDIDTLFVRGPELILRSGQQMLERYIVLMCAVRYFFEAQSIVERAYEIDQIDIGAYHKYMSYISCKYRAYTPAMVRLLNHTVLPRKFRLLLNTIFSPLWGSFEVRKFPHGS